MVNKVILIGNLGADPELKTVGDSVVAKVGVATTSKWKDRQGERQEETTWHDVEAWGSLAEVMGKYLRKGSKVYVEGTLRRDVWEDKETGKKRSKVFVRALTVQFLDTKGDNAGVGGQGQSSGSVDDDIDIPF